MTREEQIAKARAFAERLLVLARQEEHGCAIDGLMLAFMSVATAFPCCTEGAASMCVHNARLLFDKAAAQAFIDRIATPKHLH